MSADREPVSVLVPTVEWTPACDDLVGQLRDCDELLVICDSASDPVADRETPVGATVLIAGDPVGCSGKANAMACGTERAANDRFVWTDADFRRADDWLDRLVTAGRNHGPATAIPYFYGGGWWRLTHYEAEAPPLRSAGLPILNRKHKRVGWGGQRGAERLGLCERACGPRVEANNKYANPRTEPALTPQPQRLKSSIPT